MLQPAVVENKMTTVIFRLVSKTTPRTLRTTLLVGLLGLVACATSTPTASPRRTLTIAWIPKALNNPVFELGRAGALQRAAELTAAGPVEVEVLVYGSVASDAAEAGDELAEAVLTEAARARSRLGHSDHADESSARDSFWGAVWQSPASVGGARCAQPRGPTYCRE